MFTQKPVSGALLYLQRAFSVFVFGFVILAVISAPAEAATKRAYAGIVVDAKSGKTLYSHAADAARHPASVTKVMTLYLLFQELDAGRMKLSTKMRVSKHAAAAVPTKLGLKPGSTISVENAIKSLVTLSANDISRVIAEHISGTESQFAKRMTKTAKALGMKRTTYRNASGLPDKNQITTVRDQSRLGIAIYQHFPKHYEYFQIRSFKYGKRTYGNHNRLLGQNGVDGIKTGYIRASGYNLLTAARKNNRHIVVVAFGFDSGAKRNAKVASLVKTYIGKSRKGSYVAQAKIARPGGLVQMAAVPVTPMPRPLNRDVPVPLLAPPVVVAKASVPQIEATMPQTLIPLAPTALSLAPAPEQRPVELLPAAADNAADAIALVASNNTAATAPVPQPKPENIVGAWVSKTLRFEMEFSSKGTPLPPMAVGGTNTTIDLMPSGAIGGATKAPVQRWSVQIGAAQSENAARILIGDAATKIAPLTDYLSFIEPFTKNGQVYYRARFAGFGDRKQAMVMCDAIKEQKMSCLAIQS